jgi:hypothetical protein
MIQLVSTGGTLSGLKSLNSGQNDWAADAKEVGVGNPAEETSATRIKIFSPTKLKFTRNLSTRYVRLVN